MNIEIWNTLAQANDYDSIEELLKDRYGKKEESMETIALDLNVNRRTIARLLIQFDICSRDKRVEVVLTEHELNNLTLGQIARRYNISKSTAWRLRKKATEPETPDA
jgi:orotate phosphoribosyltransferase-like protein